MIFIGRRYLNADMLVDGGTVWTLLLLSKDEWEDSCSLTEALFRMEGGGELSKCCTVTPPILAVVNGG